MDTTPDAQRSQRAVLAELPAVPSPEGLESGMPPEGIEPGYDSYDDDLAAELEVGLIDETEVSDHDALVQVPPHQRSQQE
jgi:hypothetical protein